MTVQINNKIVALSVFVSAVAIGATIKNHQGAADIPVEDRPVLCEPLLPTWATEKNPGFSPEDAVRLQFVSSEEVEEFALSLVFQLVRQAVVYSDDLLHRQFFAHQVETIWNTLPFEARVNALYMLSESGQLWETKTYSSMGEKHLLPTTAIVAKLAIKTHADLEDKIKSMGDYRPVQVADIDSMMLISPGTDPATIQDLDKRKRYTNALKEADRNALHNTQLDSYKHAHALSVKLLPMNMRNLFDYSSSVDTTVIDRVLKETGIGDREGEPWSSIRP